MTIIREVNQATPDHGIGERTVRNAKQYEKRKNRLESTNRVNVADDVLAVLAEPQIPEKGNAIIRQQTSNRNFVH